MILLDTSVCIRILRGRPETIARHVGNAGNVALPFMVVGELYYGVAKSKDPVAGKLIVDKFTGAIPIIHSTCEIMARFGVIKADLSAKGIHVEDADTLIAAMALELRMPLATGNVRHFSRFQGLELVDSW